VRSGGWWGVLFALGLLVAAAMVSLPTAAQSGEEIKAFYGANRQVIIVQQVVDVLLVVPLLGFALSLDRRALALGRGGPRLLILAGLAVATAELVTNVPPLALAAMAEPSPATAHTLTFAEDLFALVVARSERSWVRIIAFVVAGLALVRAFVSPLGVPTFDAAAPIAFLAFVLVLSARVIAADLTHRS